MGLASRKICWANARFPPTRFTEFTRSERSRTWDSPGASLANYPDYIRALATVKKAAARANRDAHVIDARRQDAIERACDALIRGEHLAQFPVDMLAGGGGIAVNMNVNEVIANLANEHLGGARGTYLPVHPKRHVNASQSTADVCHTAVRMTVLNRWRGLQRTLRRCVAAFRAKAAELRPVITISRTCLQDASRVSLGELFGGHAEVVARRAAEIERSVRSLTRINLGGTAIGSGSGAPASYRRAIVRRLNEIAGQKFTLRPNLYDAAQNIDDLAAVSARARDAGGGADQDCAGHCACSRRVPKAASAK